jgi:hypothetical protein
VVGHCSERPADEPWTGGQTSREWIDPGDDAFEIEALKSSVAFVPGPFLAAPYGRRGLDQEARQYRLMPKG